MGTVQQSPPLDVGYPIYGAAYVNNKTLLVTGGGGEGNHGIPNKITAVKCLFKQKDPAKVLQRFREIVLPKTEDSPMCIDVERPGSGLQGSAVFIGCNQSTELIKKMDVNNSLRKYSFTTDEHLRFVDAAQLEKGTEVGEYPRIIKLAPQATVGCFLTSKLPSELVFFDLDALETKVKYTQKDGKEIVDFSISPNDEGKTLAYITLLTIETVSPITGSIISTSAGKSTVDAVLSKYKLSKIRFIDDTTVVIAAALKGNKGIAVLTYSLLHGKILQETVVSKKIKGVPAFDISVALDLVAIGGNDDSLIILRLSDFKTLLSYKKIHQFTITGVKFSPNGTSLATVSAANTLKVFKFPVDYSRGRSTIGTLFNYLLWTILVVLLSVGLQKAHELGHLELSIAQAKSLLGQAYSVSLELIQKGYAIAENLSSKGVGFVKDKLKDENVTENVPGYIQMDDDYNRKLTENEDYIIVSDFTSIITTTPPTSASNSVVTEPSGEENISELEVDVNEELSDSTVVPEPKETVSSLISETEDDDSEQNSPASATPQSIDLNANESEEPSTNSTFVPPKPPTIPIPIAIGGEDQLVELGDKNVTADELNTVASQGLSDPVPNIDEDIKESTSALLSESTESLEPTPVTPATSGSNPIKTLFSETDLIGSQSETVPETTTSAKRVETNAPEVSSVEFETGDPEIEIIEEIIEEVDGIDEEEDDDGSEIEEIIEIHEIEDSEDESETEIDTVPPVTSEMASQKKSTIGAEITEAGISHTVSDVSIETIATEIPGEKSVSEVTPSVETVPETSVDEEQISSSIQSSESTVSASVSETSEPLETIEESESLSGTQKPLDIVTSVETLEVLVAEPPVNTPIVNKPKIGGLRAPAYDEGHATVIPGDVPTEPETEKPTVESKPLVEPVSENKLESEMEGNDETITSEAASQAASEVLVESTPETTDKKDAESTGDVKTEPATESAPSEIEASDIETKPETSTESIEAVSSVAPSKTRKIKRVTKTVTRRSKNTAHDEL